MTDLPDLTACPLCPTTDSPGRFDTSGHCQAFCNIAPIVRGHVLVAPLSHVRSLHELSGPLRAEFFDYAYRITARVLERTGTAQFDWAIQDGVAAGQTVGHLHLHVLPRREGDLERPGSWFTSLFGPASGVPDSSARPRLDESALRAEVSWLLADQAGQPA